MKYLVRWEIDSDAATPLEAAREARATQLRPDTTATVFDVFEPGAPFTEDDNAFRRGLHGPKPTRIDLQEQEEPTGPLYDHDCNQCVYLGRYAWTGDTHDLYYCPHGGEPDTLVARFGDEGHQYTSGIWGEHPALAEARQRAEKAGLL